MAQDTLEVKCDVKDPKGCSDKEVKYIESMRAKSAEDRAKELTRLSNMKVGPREESSGSRVMNQRAGRPAIEFSCPATLTEQ